MRASLHYHQLAWWLLAPLPTAAISTLLPTLKTSLLLIGFTPKMCYPLFPRLLQAPASGTAPTQSSQELLLPCSQGVPQR